MIHAMNSATAQLNSITASAIETANSQSRGCMIHIVITLCSVSSTARVDLSVDVPLPSSLTVRTLGQNGLPTNQILCPDPMAGHRVVRWRPSGARPQGQACGYRMEVYQPARTALWLSHGSHPAGSLHIRPRISTHICSR